MKYDDEIIAIADYVCNFDQPSAIALQTAQWCLLDSLGCALAASQNQHTQPLLGPEPMTTNLPDGCPIPGTAFRLPPQRAAWNIGLLIRWLDFNDTWLAAEWGHPSDNLGAILATAYFQAGASFDDVLLAMIKTYEIQGVLALKNSFNAHGLDHVILVKVASTAVVTHMMGGSHEQICAAVSHAWVDGHPCRTYRHAPNVTARKSWASGDACARAVQIAQWALAGQAGCKTALSAARWGVQDALLAGESLVREQAYSAYIMENILFKVSFPAEFHGQTAVECALQLHSQIGDRLTDIQKIEIKTQAAAMAIINKTGILHNVADRDHALQYMVAVALIKGSLTAADYEDAAAADPQIDALRDKMTLTEAPAFTEAYHARQQRAIANAVRIHFTDGSVTDWVQVDYPAGHPQRRDSVLPLLKKKCLANVSGALQDTQAQPLLALWDEPLTAFRQRRVRDLLLSLSAEPSL